MLFVVEGEEAARLGLPAVANPYEAGSLEHEAWLDGWDEDSEVDNAPKGASKD